MSGTRISSWPSPTPDTSLATVAIYVQLIDALEKTISWFWKARDIDTYDHWARSCFGTYEGRKGKNIIIKEPFLALCTKFGLEHYVVETLWSMARTSKDSAVGGNDEGTDAENRVAPRIVEGTLLSYALEFLVSRQKTVFPLSSYSLVPSLIRRTHVGNQNLQDLIGAANSRFDSPLTRQFEVTPWAQVLSRLRDAKRRGWIEPFDTNPEGTARWTRIVRMLLQEGNADEQAFLKWNGFDKEAYARDIIMGSQQLGGIDDWWIYGLRQLYQDL
jgi:hypothetical protein